MEPSQALGSLYLLGSGYAKQVKPSANEYHCIAQRDRDGVAVSLSDKFFFWAQPRGRGLSMAVGYFGLISLIRHLADTDFDASTKTYD